MLTNSDLKKQFAEIIQEQDGSDVQIVYRCLRYDELTKQIVPWTVQRYYLKFNKYDASYVNDEIELLVDEMENIVFLMNKTDKTLLLYIIKTELNFNRLSSDLDNSIKIIQVI